MKSFFCLFSIWIALSVQNLAFAQGVPQHIDQGSLGFETEGRFSPDLDGPFSNSNGSMVADGYWQNQTESWQADSFSTIIEKADTGIEKTSIGGLGLTGDLSTTWDLGQKGPQIISVEQTYRTLLDSQRDEYSSQLLASWEKNPRDVQQSLQNMFENWYQNSTNPNETPPRLSPNETPPRFGSKFGNSGGNQLGGGSFTICLRDDCTGNESVEDENGDGSRVKCPSLECATKLINMVKAQTLCKQLALELFNASNGCADEITYSELIADPESSVPFFVKVIPDSGPRNRAYFKVLLFGPSSSLTTLDNGYECIDFDIYYYVGFDGLPGRIVDINTLYVGSSKTACSRQDNLHPKFDKSVEMGLIEKLASASEKAWKIDTSPAIIANK